MPWGRFASRWTIGYGLGAFALAQLLGCGGGTPDSAQATATPTASASGTPAQPPSSASAAAATQSGHPTDDEPPHKPRASIAIHWLTEHVTRNKFGKAVKDGPMYVSLVATGDVKATERLGDGAGECSTHATFGLASVCEDPTAQALSQIVCGGEHIDHVLCYDAVRTDEGIQVTRRLYNILGGKPKLEKSGAVKEIKVPPTAHVSYSASDEQKDISE